MGGLMNGPRKNDTKPWRPCWHWPHRPTLKGNKSVCRNPRDGAWIEVLLEEQVVFLMLRPYLSLYRLFCDPMDCRHPPAPSPRLRLFCPWDFQPGVGCHFFLQRIFLTQRSKPRLLRLLHWKSNSLPLSHQGSLYQATPPFRLVAALEQWGLWSNQWIPQSHTCCTCWDADLCLGLLPRGAPVAGSAFSQPWMHWCACRGLQGREGTAVFGLSEHEVQEACHSLLLRFRVPVVC